MVEFVSKKRLGHVLTGFKMNVRMTIDGIVKNVRIQGMKFKI